MKLVKDNSIQYYYIARISYLGTNYSGLQRQTKNPNTIQERIESTLTEVLNYEKVKISVASRTDTGVHALCQYIKIKISKEFDPFKLQKILNHKLPLDIRINQLVKSTRAFNLQKAISTKTYRYYFCHDTAPLATKASTIYHSYTFLNIEKMKKAALLFEGEHDLIHFCVLGARASNSKRTLISCEIIEDPQAPLIFYLEIKANGFLKYMVRFIMGSLLKVGEEKITVEDIKRALKDVSRQPLPYKAPPHGLQLYHMEFLKNT